MNFSSQGIDRPNENDVLCARGNGVRDHRGNVRYRFFVDTLKDECVAAAKQEKPLFAKIIVARIRGLVPPGRFLRKGDETVGQDGELWYDIGDKNAIAKTSQALREGATEIRKKSVKPEKTNNTFRQKESLKIIDDAICAANDAIQFAERKGEKSTSDIVNPSFVSSSSIEDSFVSVKKMDRRQDGQFSDQRGTRFQETNGSFEEWGYHDDDTVRRCSITDENGLEDWGVFRTYDRTNRTQDSLDRSVYVSDNTFDVGSSIVSGNPIATEKSVSFKGIFDQGPFEQSKKSLSKSGKTNSSSISIQSLVENIDNEIDNRLNEISISSGVESSFTKNFNSNSNLEPKKPRFGSLSLSHSSEAKVRLLRCSSLSNSAFSRQMSICSIFSNDEMNDSDSRIFHNVVYDLIEDERAKVKNAIAGKGDKIESLTDEDFLNLYSSDISEMVLSFQSLNSLAL